MVGAIFNNTVNTDNPVFRWTRPAKLPFGLATYEVAITGETSTLPALSSLRQFSPFTGDAFFVECFSATGDAKGTGAACNGATETGDEIQITVQVSVPDGTHVTQVRVVPVEGAPGQPVSLNFTVDATPPSTADLVAPPDQALLGTSTPLFVWAASPSTADVFDYVLRVASGDINTGPIVLEVEVLHPTIQFQVTGDLTEGRHDWQVIARDKALNTGASGVRTFTIDTRPSAAPILLTPPDDAFLNITTPLFTWAAPAGDPFDYLLQVVSGDISTGAIVLDVAVPHPTTQFQTTGGLANGRHQWRVIARDLALNTASSVVSTFTVDTVAPAAPALVAPPDLALLNVSVPLFVWEPSPSTGDVIDYLLQVAKGNVTTGSIVLEVVVTHPTTQFQATGDLAEGRHEWRVIARDRALNTASSLARTFTVDTVAPFGPPLVAPPDQAFLNVTTPLFDWEPSPSTGDVFDYLLQVASGDINTEAIVLEVEVLHPTTQFLSTGDLGDRRYEWRVIARDKVLNTASSVVRTFTVDTVAPIAPALVAPAEGAFLNTDTPIFAWKPSPSTADRFGYRLQVVSGDGFATGSIALDVVLTGDVTQFQVPTGDALADAPYKWRVVVRDKALNTAASSVGNFKVDTLAPFAPTGLERTGDLESLTPQFLWNRSSGDRVPTAPPGTGAGSGVDFYDIVLTGRQTVTTTADDSDAVCPAGICQFTSPELLPGDYTIAVKTVDLAANLSQPATTDFRAGPPGLVQNLRIIGSIFDNTVNTDNPVFRWTRPAELPLGLATYEIAITGEASTLPPLSSLRQFRPFTGDDFFVECFNATGDAIGTGVQCSGTGATVTGDEIQITVEITVPDGTHEIQVRVVTVEAGPSVAISETFTIDTTEPTPPTLLSPEPNEFLNTGALQFDWSASSGDVFHLPAPGSARRGRPDDWALCSGRDNQRRYNPVPRPRRT